MSLARVMIDRLKLYATPAMGDGPVMAELPISSLVEVYGPDVGGRDDPVCFPVVSAMHALPGYVSAKNIRFV